MTQELGKWHPSSLEHFADETPLTQLGEWINGVLIAREMTLTEGAKAFGLSSLGNLRKKPMVHVSMYSYERILEGADRLPCTSDEVSTLADIVSSGVEERLASGFPLYDRVPPKVPQHLSKSIEGGMTDSAIARQLVESGASQDFTVLRNRVYRARKRHGFNPVVTKNQAALIMGEVL